MYNFFHHPIVHTVNTHSAQHNTTPTEEDQYSQHKNNGSEYWTHATRARQTYGFNPRL